MGNPIMTFLQNILIAIVMFLLAIMVFLFVPWKKVSWERWDSAKGIIYFSNAEFAFQIFPSSYGMTTGGAPHRLRMRIIGQTESHVEAIVHSIIIETSKGSSMEISDAEGRSYSFGQVPAIRFDAGEHGIDVGFTDSIPYDYDPDMKLRLIADISVTTKAGTQRGIVVEQFNPFRHREWVNMFKVIISV